MLSAIELSLAIGLGRLIAIDRSDRDAGDSLASADPSHSLVARRLDADPCRRRLGKEPLDLRPGVAEAGLLADDADVDVDDPAADRADDRAQQVDRVGVAPALLV